MMITATILAIALLQQLPQEQWTTVNGKVTFSEDGLRLEGGSRANSKSIKVRPHGIYRLSAKVRQVSGSGAYMIALIWRDKAGKVLGVDNSWTGKDRPSSEVLHGGRFTAPPRTHDVIVALGVRRETVCQFDAVEVRFEKMSAPYDISLSWLGVNGESIDAPLKCMVDPSWFAAPKKFRTIGGWKPVAGRYRSSSFPVEPGRLYVVEADERTVVFAPPEAARAQVEVAARGKFALDTVHVWAATEDVPPLKPRPKAVWICPDFRTDPSSLFKSDAPWGDTRQAIQCYKFHLRILSKADGHASWVRDWRVDTSQAASALNKAGLGIAVETAGLYGSQKGETGLKSARAELAILNPLVEAGGRIQTLTLDGPISRVIKGGRQKGDGGAAGTLGYSLKESVDHLVTYIETVSQAQPGVEIGLIVNFGHWDFEGRESYFGKSSYSYGSGYDYDEVLDAILARGQLIRFVHADDPFDYLTAKRSPFNPRWTGERDRLLALEAYCRRKGLQFGMIYNTEARQTGSDREFYEQTLQALELYRAAGGQPDCFTVESWYEFPKRLLPETEPYTFTRLARDFAARVRELYPSD